MKWSERITTVLPPKSLWNDDGLLSAQWEHDLSAAQLRELLRVGPVQFLVVDVGAKPLWVPEENCFAFWKGEVKPHLADPDQTAYKEQFADGYCYFAAKWRIEGGSPIVVLQRCH